jgi:alanyl-tRNA synthetase
MKPQEIRTAYLNFFKSKGHSIVPSDTLVPSNDPTLLFTTAGMVQFKGLYAGAALLYPTAATVQKCLRAGGKGSDLEKVGKTLRHHTFFEMLGNFSFGDYFKKEAIHYAWEFITAVLKMDTSKLWVSVFEDDDEAKELWIQLGFPKERIVKLGKEDNFWGPAGNEGACGPCSEIYYDLGPNRSCGKPSCAVGCDCERYLEFWNLVFPQFYQNPDGSRKALARRGVDTGMGLERLSFLMDSRADNNYQTEIFKPIIQVLVTHTGIPYEEPWISAFHVVADHIRALTFSIGDGVLPSNEGRGYVIRRILRRAVRFGQKLGIRQPFLFDLARTVVECMKEQYPELSETLPMISKIIRSEEERFIETLKRGEEHLKDLLYHQKFSTSPMLSGDWVFHLYDTLGLPLDVIQEEAEEQNIPVDIEGFQKRLAEQKSKGQQSWKGTSYTEDSTNALLKDQKTPTYFLGHEFTFHSASILAIIENNTRPLILGEGNEGILILNQTVFYAEGGGQIADTGYIVIGDEVQALVLDVQKSSQGIYLHMVKMIRGALKVGDKVHLIFDFEKRKEIQKHHTATHMLQFVLQEHLGKHVKQAGSLVTMDRLRFDFSHTQKITPEEIEKIEDAMNTWILKNDPLSTCQLDLEEAKKQNITANFGEKYGERVRAVFIGSSKELCGGTHAPSSGVIGGFKILSESSVAAGVRRIEAVVGKAFLKNAREQAVLLKNLGAYFKVAPESVFERVEAQTRKIKELEKQIALSHTESQDTLSFDVSFQAGTTQIMIQGYSKIYGDSVLKILDKAKSKNKDLLLCLGFINNDQIQYIAARQGSVHFDCAKLIREISAYVGGKGGGKPDMARGGGKDLTRFEASLKHVEMLIRSEFPK